MEFFLSTPKTEIDIPKRFSVKFTFIVLPPDGLYPVERYIIIQNKMVAMVFHSRAANRQDFPSCLMAARSQRHMRHSLLFSRVTLCSADVSLGKWLDSKAWLRLCLALLPVLAPSAQSETCEPGGERVAKYMLVFRKEHGVEVTDPHESLQWNGLMNQLNSTVLSTW